MHDHLKIVKENKNNFSFVNSLGFRFGTTREFPVERTGAIYS
jgi:hypothetical protein